MPKDDQLYNSYLVQSVRRHPCLYNCNQKEYSNKRMTNDAWEIVAGEMKDSVVNCKEKWRNLRIVFSRYLQRSLNGNGTSKNKYYLYEQMKFLKPFVRCRIGQTYLPYPDEETVDNLETDHDSISIKETGETVTNDITDKQLEGHFMEPTNPRIKLDDSEKQSEDVFDYYSDNLRKRAKYLYEVDQSDTDFSRSDQINTTSYRLKFLESLLPDVEEMTSAQFRKFRKKVNDTIDEIFESTNSGCNTTTT